HHGLRKVFAANARDLYFLSSADSHLVGKLGGNFNERLGHKLDIHGIVFGPVVIVLGEAIGGADQRVTLLHGSVFVQRSLKLLGDRVMGLVGVQRIRDWTLDRLIVLGKRPVSQP